MCIHDLHPESSKVLGSFFTVLLAHSQECSSLCFRLQYFAALWLKELGPEPAPAKRAGLLHDLGKAIDHEVEVPRCSGALLVMVSVLRLFTLLKLTRRRGANTVLGMLVMAADAISAASGARRGIC